MRNRSRFMLATGFFMFGLGFFCSGLFWIVHVLKTFAGFPFPAAVISMLSLSAFLALYYLFAMLLALWGFGEDYMTGLPLTFFLTEIARGHILGGFPWNQWGQAFVHVPIINKIASFMGLTGLSSFLLFVTLTPFYGKKGRMWSLGFILLVLSLATWQEFHVPGVTGTITGAVIQPNIDEEKRYHGEEFSEWGIARSLAMPMIRQDIDLLVFPESVVLKAFHYYPELTRDCHSWSEEGVDVLMNGNVKDPSGEWYNACFLFSRGSKPKVYKKVHLVPFGEYLPFRSFFEKLGFDAIARSVGDFKPWPRIETLDGNHRYGVSICYEIVFSHMVRKQVQQGAEILVTMTNDAWYGNLGAGWQHYSQAVFRSIEYRRPLFRSALTGISFISEPGGAVRGAIPERRKGAFMASVPLCESNTLYYFIQPYLFWLSVLAYIGLITWRRYINA